MANEPQEGICKLVHTRPEMKSDSEFMFKGIRYLTSTTDFSNKTGPDGVVLLKPSDWIEMYCDLVEREKIRKVLEIGVWQGGMSVFLPSFEPELQYMGVDFSPEIAPLRQIIDDLPMIRDRVRIDFRTDQADPSLPARVREYFGSPDLDLIIDDASHMYAESRRSFELFFPLLRPGAAYIVEDWAWAHWNNYVPDKRLAAKPSLSNLLFEISILAASAPDIVASIEVSKSIFIVRRGQASLEDGWNMSESMRFNGQSPNLPMLKPVQSHTKPKARKRRSTQAKILGWLLKDRS